MPFDITMSALGESVTEGTITRLLKAVGDSVSVGDPLIEVSTDKVDTEVPSPVAGVVIELTVSEDETVAVGSVIAAIEVAPEDGVGEAHAHQPAVPSLSIPPNGTPLLEPVGHQSDATPSTPARPEAGRPQQASPLRGSTEPLTRPRRIIATRMVDSLRTSAQLTQVVEIDVTGIARRREEVKDHFLSREGVKLSYLPFFAKAAVDALPHHPLLNATIDNEAGTATYFDHEHLAIAVDTHKGLMTPVIKHAGGLSIAEIAKRIADLADRARQQTCR